MKGCGEVVYFISVWLIFSLASFSSGFNPIDNYLIDCGSSSNTSVADRIFLSDNAASNFLSTPLDVLAQTTYKSIISSSDSPLYQTARIFTKTSTYTFPIRQHVRHWIRLYFSAFVYENYNMSTASFSVFTENHVLLDDFSTSSTISVKEFSVSVTSDDLVIMFIPSVDSFAFLNAIEVVSVPDDLITDNAVLTADTFENFKGMLNQTLETVVRVNMGGPMVSFEDDALSRTWIPDQSFLVDADIIKNFSNIEAVRYGSNGWDFAPATVYGTARTLSSRSDYNSNYFTANLTWIFDVDQGFHYLVRFHFCDILSKSLNTLYFNVYIDSFEVLPNLDLSTMRGNSLGLPGYEDYVTVLTVSNKLRVSIGPSTLPGVDPNAILNGLEIMKIKHVRSTPNSDSNKGVRLAAICVSIGGFLVVILVVVFFSFICKKWKRLVTKGDSNKTSCAAPNYGIRIPFLLIQEATNHFDESLIIGAGGFGMVYKGVLKDGTKVAIKRNKPGSQQGLIEFRTEVEMLSQFHHRHLVSLIGYCQEENEMILLYEYVENGTLSSHLCGSGRSMLSWKQRLEICIGAARGLHYLHTGPVRAVIHRDVKSTNILLDENLIAKVADFGLSKTGPDLSQVGYVSTAVKGSFGYLDPEYFRKQRLTLKSDVYSFGVVLLEVLCGRAAVDSTLPTEKIGLAGWAMTWHKTGKLEQIIDPAVAGEIKPDSLRKFGETAEKCLAEVGAKRPSMGEVLWNLECALELQEAMENDTIPNVQIDDLPKPVDKNSESSISIFE
ncbi:hypothetical protein TIFTF001_016276 [Ficus carica]|uniref:Protein kinase domain-containing protein n=1 Tax=Ficus carica TaxID=3494 RepID=A0AA88AJB5_FICCA|nr:hypothetical protein TIFTF001_016276 [Ficus carica]